MTTTGFVLQSLGTVELAEQIARRAEASVPAYKRFLRDQRWDARERGRWNRPCTDKANYLAVYPYEELLADEWERTYTIFKSSGSSGHRFYWPQLKYQHHGALDRLRGFLEGHFHVHQSKTLAVVGLALGSWIGGEHLSWALKSLALAVPYPFSVFSPGSDHAEIIEILCAANRFVDQFLLFLCPGAIAHLHLKAQRAGRALPVDKLRYVVLGEPFPESLRLGLMKNLRQPATTPVMLSVYGSADTGLLGAESPASVALRQLLTQNAALARELEIDPPLPHFFHLAAEDAHLESVGGEMCVTRWQGIPLVRYNLHDRVRFFSWQRLCEAVLQSPALRPQDAALAQSLHADALADVVAVAGRSDGCLLLCGTNLSETMLDSAVRTAALEKLLTGAYRARVLFEGERQYLEFDLELSSPRPLDAEQKGLVYRELIQALGREQPEFLDDWNNVYRTWDDDPALRILRLRFVPFPELSQRSEQQIKTRGIGS